MNMCWFHLAHHKGHWLLFWTQYWIFRLLERLAISYLPRKNLSLSLCYMAFIDFSPIHAVCPVHHILLHSNVVKF